MTASDLSLSVLVLFSLERPKWTAEEVAEALEVGIATAYRYLSALDEAGLVASTRPGRFGLGPAITRLDRQLRLTDPLLNAAVPVTENLSKQAPAGSVMLLCRAVSDSVLCIHRVHVPGHSPAVSNERGRPMPLFYGATSKFLLAYMAPRRMKAVFARHTTAIGDAGLGKTLADFRATLQNWRKAGFITAHAEVDAGSRGIAAAVLGTDRTALGSISFVVSDRTGAATIARLGELVVAGAREVEDSLQREGCARS